ncbi:MAG: marine proteobacterial sortase target protein [Pseudomonadales bacterium]|nr:marine proteobacterial sortase target protein [Pseudomonadales bacterium]
MSTKLCIPNNNRHPDHRLWDRARGLDLWCSGFVLLVFLLFQSSANAAAEVYENLDQVGAGSLLTHEAGEYRSLLRMGNSIALQVNGMLVNAEIEQQFKNDSQEWIEATYVFPLPSESAVNSMHIKIGDRIIEGVIKERQQAKKIYLQAKKQGKHTGLLEQQRPNLFTTKVANIAPGETVVVAFSYLQTLDYDQGEFSLRIPLTLTPRYIPGNPLISDLNKAGYQQDDLPALSQTQLMDVGAKGWSFATDQVPDAPEITPPQILPSDAINHRAQLSVHLKPGFELAEVVSPYHNIKTQRQSDSYLIKPANNPVIMNKDFVLTWRPVPQQAPTAAVFKESKSNNKTPIVAEHGLLMLMPPERISGDVVPPRELIIIIDTSGSMAGASIEQAKQAVQMALKKLRPQDLFNVIEFNSVHRSLFASSEPASHSAKRQAMRFVSSLKANGGTEMYSALDAAFQFPYQETHLRQVVFITDGSVGNEHALFELIHRDLGNSRLYTVGIGSAPNEFFMRKAAEFGKGSHAFIGSPQEVQTKIAALFGKIEKPVMTNIRIQAEGVKAEVFPALIPDLYQGEPLIVHAKFDQWPRSLLIEGEFDGQPWSQTLLLHAKADAAGVATLWAREKVQSLEDQGVVKGNRDQYKQQILAIGLDYGIVTRFTSFVAVAKEVVRPTTDSLKSKSVPNLMPAGSKQPPPTVGMPSTALGVDQMLWLGLLCMLSALMLYVLQYRCHFFAIRCDTEEARHDF